MTTNNLLDKPNKIYSIDKTGITSYNSPFKIVYNKDTKAQTVTSIQNSEINNVYNVIIILKAITKSSVGQHGPRQMRR
jgi:hypothetical protein